MRSISAFSTDLATGLALVLLAGSGGHAQAPQTAAPQVTFRAASDYVEVDTYITDRDGRFVRDLTAADFEVLEDGKPQRIEAFSLIDLPFERADAPPARDDEPGYISNEGGIEGRIYMIVLDTAHVAALRTPKLKQILRQFVLDNVAANDQVAVVHVGGSAASLDFTSNKRLVLDSIDAFVGQKLRSQALSKFDALLRLGDDPKGNGALPAPRDPEASRRASLAAETFQSLSKLGDYMAGIQGRRKAILLVSEGLDINMIDRPSMPNTEVDPSNNATYFDTNLFNNTDLEAALAQQVEGEIQTMVQAATRANVAVYTIDPRGLADASEESIEFAGPPGGGGAADRLMPTTALRRELRDSQMGLRNLAEQTGGLAIVGTNNFADGFSNIVKDNSTYYVLGYRTSPKYDGKFHDITVKVKQPGLEVRARKGYYARKVPPAVARDVLHELLTSPMAMPGLGMRARTTVLRGTAPNALVEFMLEFPGETLTFEDKGGTFANTIEISYLAADADGNTKATGSKTLDMVLNPEGHAAAVADSLRFATEMPLAPGRYQMRLAAKESAGGRAGSIFWTLDVPDYSNEALAMSDLILTSARAAMAPTVHDATTLKSLLPAPPTIARVFTLEDTLVVFTEAYERAGTEPHTLDFTIVVTVDDSGGDVFTAEETRESSARNAERGGYPYIARIPLRDLVPGHFTVAVEVTSSLGPTTKRQLKFQIE